MNRIALGLALAASTLPARETVAQAANPAPPAARELVVNVHSYFRAVREFGSGVIVGLDRERVYIATARHVVRGAEPASLVYISLFGSARDSIPATPSDSMRTDLDVAVLTVARAAFPPGWDPPAFDRLGRVEALTFGSTVSPMGCPQGICWGVPVPADRVVALDRQGIAFQSGYVNEGSSGGALFNQWWEIVGLVTEDAPPQANAVPIDVVLGLVRAWGYPVSLRRAKVPRAGYPLHVGALVLTRLGTSDDSLGGEGRLPSGRLVATRRGDLYGLTWHLSGLRLAPPNLAVTAAMTGVGLDFHYGRFIAQPFIEVGIGRVEGRFDAGGYYVSAADTPAYVPFWRQQKQDGLGVGAGLSAQALVAPHLTLELLGGHWSFNVPDSLPNLPSFFVGTGLRLGM